MSFLFSVFTSFASSLISVSSDTDHVGADRGVHTLGVQEQHHLKATEELHANQQVELAEADRVLGQETLRVQALEAQLQE